MYEKEEPEKSYDQEDLEPKEVSSYWENQVEIPEKQKFYGVED